MGARTGVGGDASHVRRAADAESITRSNGGITASGHQVDNVLSRGGPQSGRRSGSVRVLSGSGRVDSSLVSLGCDGSFTFLNRELDFVVSIHCFVNL